MFNQPKSLYCVAFFILAVIIGFAIILDWLEWLAQPDQGLKEPPVLNFNLCSGFTVMLPESLLLDSFSEQAALSPDEFEYSCPRLMALSKGLSSMCG